MYALRSQNFGSSPISSLPVELLSEIFSLCILATGEPGADAEDMDFSPPIINTENVRVPLILSSVNRRWREVTLGQTSLWSNICITAELINNPYDDNTLDATHITTYLKRSRQSPLNILIDGRDPDWDFSEADVGVDFGMSHFSTLFSTDHMKAAISLLVPYLSRWKSLTILTDAWAPMYAALSMINPSITCFGAPLLESMSLIRCNDFVSFIHRFQPHNLKDLGFLSRDTAERTNMLPRLKHLSLRGVHVDWDSLSDALAASPAGLEFLELASHSKDVRPSAIQFQQLLKATPALRKLTVVGSGPEGPGSEDDDAMNHVYGPAHLPHLQDITIGYRTEHGGKKIVKFLDAPNAKSLTLEDAGSPADPVEINAGSMLTYLGSKELYEPSQTQEFMCTHHTGSGSQSFHAAFPLLERVTLKGVKALHDPLRIFFSSLPYLQHLELIRMSMVPVYALLPCVGASVVEAGSSCPCPELRSLCIRGSDQLEMRDLDFIIQRLAAQRQVEGARALEEVDIHVDAARAASVQVAAAAASPDTRVNIISDSEDDSDEDEDMDMEEVTIDPEAEKKAYEYGGTFHDPEFDSQFQYPFSSYPPSSQIAAH